MKTRITAWILTIVLMLGLTACGNGSPLSFAGTEPATEPTEGDGNESPVIPAAVDALSEEDTILLNGELKDGVYINRYFGYKLSVPEGGTLVRDNDDATESTEIISLRKAYEEEWGGLCFTAEVKGIDGFLNVFIKALDDDEIGLSEEALVKKNIDEIWDINKAFGEDRGPEFRTGVLAGEEHPMTYQTSETLKGTQYSADFYIPKGDFEYIIFIYVTGEGLEDMISLFERI